jgi:hypothetical protein
LVLTLIRLAWVLVLLWSAAESLAGEGGGGEHAGKHRVRVTPDMEEQKGLMLTAESNIYQGTVYANAFLEYLTEGRWDVGLYCFNMTLYGGGAQNFEYDAYVSITKWLDVSDRWKVALGTQNGTTLFSANRSWHNFSFVQNAVRLHDDFTVSVGMFYVNQALATINQPIGALVGFDMTFIPRKLWAELDFLSGNSNVSGGVANLFWKPTQQIEFYAGIQVPATGSGNEFAGNVGLMYSLE